MWVYRAGLAVRRPLGAWWGLSRDGAGHVPADGPLLVAPNHASFLDPFLVSGLFPRWPIRWLINEPWYRRSPVWTAAFRSCAVIPADARDPRITLGRVEAALGTGHVVGVFPEGRISPDGRLGPARLGIGRLAAATGVPVVPCGLRGAFESLPRHRRFPRRVPIELRIGAPLVFPGGPDPDPPREAIVGFVDRLMLRIAELAGGGLSLPGTGTPRSDPSGAAVPGSAGSPEASW